MKNYIKKISYLFLSLTLLLGSCEVEESLKITSPDAEFFLNTPGISSVFLNFDLPNNPAFTITWIDEINTDATYNVEMSLEDTFFSPIQLGATPENNFTMNVVDFNQVLTDASIKSFEDTGVYIRLNTSSSISNTILLQVSKFAVALPVITSPANGTSIELTDVAPDATALTLEWNDPEISASSTVSISYNIEMIIAGGNFSNSILVGSSATNSFEISHDALNDIVIAGGGVADTATDFDFRITAIAKTAAGDLNRASEKTTISVTTFKTAIPDNLFMVGSHNGWNNADVSQQFFNDGNGVFVKVQQFTAGQEFKMLPTSGNWSGDWGESKTNSGNLEQDDEQNIKIATSGNYLVVVDFNTLTFKLKSIDTLFMVGGHNGWNNADASQQFNTSGNGVFTRIQTFTQGDEFKMLPTSGDWSGDWGESKTTAGILEQDDEQNIKVTTSGTYMVTVDFNTISYNLLEVPTNLHLVGSPNGWDNATAPAFTKISEGLFELTQTLTSDDEFKFLPVQGSWDNDWGESKKHPGMIVKDDENNVKSPGNGTFKITVDYNKGTVTVL